MYSLHVCLTATLPADPPFVREPFKTRDSSSSTAADTAADPPPFAALDKKIAFKGLRAKKPGVRPFADVPTMRRPVELLAGAPGGCGGAPDW